MSEHLTSTRVRVERKPQPAARTGEGELPAAVDFAAGPLPMPFSTTSPDTQTAMLRRLPIAQRQWMITHVGRVQGNRHVQRLLASVGQGAAAGPLQRVTPELPPPRGVKASSARFGGDPTFEKIAAGTETLKKGSKGIPVVKLEQALVDMGYALSKVDDDFTAETETALKKFQDDEKITKTGELDKDTIVKLNARYDTRKPYIDNATFDPADPTKGTRSLSADERTAVLGAMVPPRGVGGAPSVFTDDVGGAKYGDEIKAALTTEIAALHKDLFADKKKLRKNKAKNFHPWSVLEKTAEASKDVTDAVYGTYTGGGKPKMTHAAGNFVDQWEDELIRNRALTDPDKKQKATEKVWYLINSNAEAINRKHGAVPSDAAETAILTPIVESFVDTKAKVKKMLELDIGWEGAQLEGVVYLQRYKQQGVGATAAARKKDAAAKNRKQLWELFHVCIHEYIHSLAHDDYKAFAESFRTAGDETRYNTLIEGMDDFFTLNVRKTVAINDPLRQKVEGPFFDAAAAVPAVSVGVYPSHAQAEQVVSIVGIRNAAAAYFQGKTTLIGKP